MELFARLVHVEAGSRVVQVEARDGERLLGSALGEAGSAEEAEDRARGRLLSALGSQTRTPVLKSATVPAAAVPAADVPSAAVPAPHPEVLRPSRPAPQPPRPAQEPARPAPQPIAASAPPESETPPSLLDSAPAPETLALAPPQPDPITEPQPDPEDWSGELVAVDRQLRRLAWGREQEALYLQRAFGHPSRSRLTRYSDLRAYLLALEAMEPASDPATAAVPLRRADLLAQADGLLQQLGWGPEQGRSLLERELGCSSRSQLSDAQLLQFNMLLEGELLAAEPAQLVPPAAAAVGAQAQR
ncbi:MAG: hypothetical protein WCF98_01925 [Synechococcus sp. ELA057]